MTSDDFVENWKRLVKSGKIAELDKAAPRLSEEWLRKFYQLQPRSVRRVFTEEEFVQDRSDVEYGLGEEERRDKRMLDAVLSGNDYLHSDQYKLERARKERQQKEYQERKDQYKAWEERKDALIEQYQKEDYEVNELAYELRKKGDNKAADELVNEHYRKWNSIS